MDRWTFRGVRADTTLGVKAVTSDDIPEIVANLERLRDEPPPPRYTYSAEPEEPLLKEGVTPGWLVWTGGEVEPGTPVKVKPVAALVDGEGVVAVEDTGEWQDGTIVP